MSANALDADYINQARTKGIFSREARTVLVAWFFKIPLYLIGLVIGLTWFALAEGVPAIGRTFFRGHRLAQRVGFWRTGATAENIENAN